MKIALIGYGKMGKTLERVAVSRGHEIVLKIDVNNPQDFDKLRAADVAIEFTRPESAVSNLEKCIAAGVPVVCGTTGWLAEYERISALCKARKTGFFYASNYSIGVNIFFEINRRLADMMNGYDMYDVSMEEIHHTQKLDAPSGTAITLAEGIFDHLPRKTNWVCNTEGSPSDLTITAKRIDPAPGTHIVRYDSPIDSIEITHTAHSREGFATGAVVAAEWLFGKKGVFSMKDLLGF
ncbi:MAG: 4-hydroxy-tetrahydrodipicolinate reductase [Saprospiraceae bacterium]|nr:4-hydroxy-tetrahydrodipicolinate reductase [Saprospiraceae bacterium]